MQPGASYANAVGPGETGAAAMTFDLIAGSLIVGFWLIGKSIYLMVS